MSEPDDDEVPGPLRERFRDFQALGSGAYGAVYRATDIRLERTVVIKWLRPVTGKFQEEIRKRFEREARLLSEVQHPNLVPILDYEAVPSGSWITFAEVPGRDLRAHARAGRTGPGWVPWLLDGCLAGLEELHGRGVLHRDIKPANLLVTEDGRVVILDLGLAHAEGAREDLTKTGQFVGTVSYCSSRRIQGHPAEARDDLYSLGVVALELALGENPFLGRNLGETVARHERLEPPRPEDLPGELSLEVRRLVVSMVAKDPSERPVSAHEARQVLRRAGRVEVPAALAAPLPDLVGPGEEPSTLVPGAGTDASGPRSPVGGEVLERAPPPPGGRPLRWGPAALGVFLLAAVAGWFQAPSDVVSSPRDPGAASTSEAAGPKASQDEVLPGLDLALREVEAQVLGYLDAHPEEPPADPATWRGVLGASPALHDLRGGLAALPEAPPDEDLARLRQLDLDVAAMGLPQPLLHHRARWSEPPPCPSAGQGWPVASPYACRGLKALRALASEDRARLEMLKLKGIAALGIQTHHKMYAFPDADEEYLWSYLAYFAPRSQARGQLGHWLRPGAEELQRIVVDLSESIRRAEPGATVLLDDLVSLPQHRLRAFYFSSLAEDPLSEYFPVDIEDSPFVLLARGHILARRYSIQERYRPPDREAVDGRAAILKRALETLPERPVKLRCVAAIDLGKALKEHQRITELWAPTLRFLPDLRDCPAQLRGDLADVQLREVGRDPELLEAMPGAVRTWLDGLLPVVEAFLSEDAKEGLELLRGD